MALISASTLSSKYSQFAIIATILLTFFWFCTSSMQARPSVDSLPSVDNNFPTSSADRGEASLPFKGGSSDHYSDEDPEPSIPLRYRPDHPIDHLRAEANRKFDTLLSQETWDVHEAARIYRDRRGRHPPPGFDVWFDFARNHSAVIVEEFWDRIYDDLSPFWGVPARQIREQANDFLFRISVRKGNATYRGDQEDRPWLLLWQNMTQSVAEYLPDLDMPINILDESRMVVEWEEIEEYVKIERASRQLVPEGQLTDEYQSLDYLDRNPPEKFDPMWQRQGPYWPMAVIGCAPGSPARTAYIESDFTQPPPLTATYPEGSHEGYVQNWTLAKSPCDHAHLQGLHGTFVEPVSIANTKKFFPLFGGSKLPMNNEILLPAAMYWTLDPFYSGGEEHGGPWEDKKDAMIWRGAASGGRNRVENWTRFQRHRFVSMANGTSVRYKELQTPEAPPNIVLPTNGSYDLAALASDAEAGALGDWINTWSDAEVVHLLCFPMEPFVPRPKQAPFLKKSCSYTDPYFSVGTTMPMVEQYKYKYLPDIDGNSFSGRYRGFLGSTSLPIKATIYEEWHDSRLVPWKHFVPMDNTFADFYGIMEYFLGNMKFGVAGHDDVAKDMAIGGKKWAEKVLRREDMQIYVFRLLLEYARLCDDGRETMGWRESKTKIGEPGVT